MTRVLVFDERTDRYDIRFDLASYYGGLLQKELIYGYVVAQYKLKEYL